MLKSNKHVFWEALFVTIVIFLIGLFIGLFIENSRASDIQDYYTASEINLFDSLVITEMLKQGGLDCDLVKNENLKFADKIYQEARLLEKYDESGKLSDSIKLLHKKYDLLRTLAWINNKEAIKQCQNYDVIIYLYEYEPDSSKIKAEQIIWSEILSNVKRIMGGDLILIPIAADSELTSLNLMLSELKITTFPAVIINDKQVIHSLKSPEEILSLL